MSLSWKHEVTELSMCLQNMTFLRHVGAVMKGVKSEKESSRTPEKSREQQSLGRLPDYLSESLKLGAQKEREGIIGS